MIVRWFDKIINFLKKLRDLYLGWRLRSQIRANTTKNLSEEQDLGVYWNKDFAHELATWGINTAWQEIRYLLIHGQGRVLDIACGCGSVMKLLHPFPQFEVYGCDISDFLIQKAIEMGIPGDRLRVCDATKTPYENGSFNYSYSIGSLEHFTEEGISAFLRESTRITTRISFHQIPTSRSGKDEGWIRLGQSYFNNSVSWWMNKFQAAYPKVYVLNSQWEDPISVGKWFVCIKN